MTKAATNAVDEPRTLVKQLRRVGRVLMRIGRIVRRPWRVSRGVERRSLSSSDPSSVTRPYLLRLRWRAGGATCTVARAATCAAGAARQPGPQRLTFNYAIKVELGVRWGGLRNPAGTPDDVTAGPSQRERHTRLAPASRRPNGSCGTAAHGSCMLSAPANSTLLAREPLKHAAVAACRERYGEGRTRGCATNRPRVLTVAAVDFVGGAWATQAASPPRMSAVLDSFKRLLRISEDETKLPDRESKRLQRYHILEEINQYVSKHRSAPGRWRTRR